MDNIEDQLKNFWENETSPSQRREILRQLEESGLEWKEFLHQYYNKVLAGEESHGLGEAQKSKVWERLKEQHLSSGELRGGEAAKSERVRIAGYRWMAAACVLLIIGLCVYWWGRRPVRQGSLQGEEVAAAMMIVKQNTGKEEERLALPDHSLVLLAPGSSIRYKDGFDIRARNIQLEGRALFDVAKDSVRPFTVIAQGFATTALGTRFIVDASSAHISIRLLKGKVVVNTTAEANMAVQKVYLIPGQELRINSETRQFHLGNSFEDSLFAARSAGDKKRRQVRTGAGNNASALSFERTSLATVFQRLSEYYKTTILYDKAEVQGLSFTGSFEPSDELELTLRVICNINQLSFTKENDRIVISKQQ